jgi:hypothetical protein
MVPAVLFETIDDTTRTLGMGLAWVLNLAVAEWLIARRRQKMQPVRAGQSR